MSGAVISLGCRMNLAEGARIGQMLGQDAGTTVINSCAVTAEAVRQTRQAIRRARRERPDDRLIVTGCASEIDRAGFASMVEVDGVVANADKLDARAWNVPSAEILTDRRHTRAFIAVQNGCDHACTFCIIPQGRGPSRSLTIEQVLADVARDLSSGAAEVVLTGVDLTSWGHDLPGAPKLGNLVSAILREFPQLGRLRLSSLDGIEIDPLLEELIAGEPRVMPYIHLSLQHGHDLILKRMKRRHLREDAIALVARIRMRRPDIAIGADLIAGFPTEEHAHHVANLSIIDTLKVVHGHVFPYSIRPGTPAARMPQVERGIIRMRAQELRGAITGVRNAWLQDQVGKALSVLAEADGTGHAENFARVRLQPGTARGAIVAVTPVGIEEGMLV